MMPVVQLKIIMCMELKHGWFLVTVKLLPTILAKAPTLHFPAVEQGTRMVKSAHDLYSVEARAQINIRQVSRMTRTREPRADAQLT